MNADGTDFSDWDADKISVHQKNQRLSAFYGTLINADLAGRGL
jgi:hypothetical protein